MSDLKFTLVGSDDGKIWKIDTIEHEGELWLVPEWLEVTYPAGQLPKRAIRLTGLDYEDCPNPDADYFLKSPIPKAVLFGPTPPEEATGFVVVVRQDDRPKAKPH